MLNWQLDAYSANFFRWEYGRVIHQFKGFIIPNLTPILKTFSLSVLKWCKITYLNIWWMVFQQVFILFFDIWFPTTYHAAVRIFNESFPLSEVHVKIYNNRNRKISGRSKINRMWPSSEKSTFQVYSNTCKLHVSNFWGPLTASCNASAEGPGNKFQSTCKFFMIRIIIIIRIILGEF